MSEEQVLLINKWLICTTIANTLMYLFIGFLCWDVLWISDINEWNGFSRFMFAFLGILFNIGISSMYIVFYSDAIGKNFNLDKERGR